MPTRLFRHFTKFSFVLFLLLSINLGYAKLEIIVKDSPDWGPISKKDVKKLAENIAYHFEIHLRPENEIDEATTVYRTSERSHVTLNRIDLAAKYKIGVNLYADMELTVKHVVFFTLGFAHEFCHILHNFDITSPENPNRWFTESIAEMSSIWALQEMSKTWENNSPFGPFEKSGENIVAIFSDNLKLNADFYKGLVPDQMTGIEWLKEYETFLRDEYERTKLFNQHELVSQLGYKFLPIFESNPEAWNAVRKMPASKAEMSEYMKEWYRAVDIQDRKHVKAIADVMGVTVADSAIVAIRDTGLPIDADIDNNGFVDLSDVLLVRSAIENPMPYDTDVNNDGITDEVDLLLVKQLATAAIVAASPRKQRIRLGTWATLKKVR